MRTVCKVLMLHGMIEGMPTSKDAPAEYWKFLEGAKKDRGPRPMHAMCAFDDPQAAAAILKKRSPEFLADTSKALKFAAAHFTPATIRLGELAGRVDAAEFCAALVGPVSSRRRAFQPGPWVPPGFNYPGADKPRPTRRVGKRMAYAIMAHYGLGTALPSCITSDCIGHQDSSLLSSPSSPLAPPEGLMALSTAARELMPNEDMSEPCSPTGSSSVQGQIGRKGGLLCARASTKSMPQVDCKYLPEPNALENVLEQHTLRSQAKTGHLHLSPPPKVSSWVMPSKGKVFGWTTSTPKA